MATPNYGYEKRQKELAKKRKKEEKLKAKADKSRHGDSGGDGDAHQDDAADTGATPPADGNPAQG